MHYLVVKEGSHLKDETVRFMIKVLLDDVLVHENER